MDEPKIKVTKPSETALLPQYFHSEYMYERFLDATLSEKGEIDRAINTKGIKQAEAEEVSYENLNYFNINKAKFEDEFFSELSERISEEKANQFCEIISQNWFDGKAKRESLSVLELMASIKNYLVEYRKVKNISEIRVVNRIDSSIKPNFADDEIQEIISLNREMFDGFIDR